MGNVNMLSRLMPEIVPADAGRNELLARNMQYAVPSPVMQGGYLTKLDPLEEMAFMLWVKEKNVPFDPSPNADYDMRGFYKAMKSGDPKASTGMNSNDGQLHFTDFFKTPFHESFSAESRYAKPGAPKWNESDQLVLPSGKIVFDERALKR